MTKLRRFFARPYESMLGLGIDTDYDDDGDYCHADEALARIAELESQLAARADLAADIPVITHNAELPQYDPVYVRTLQQAYSEVLAHIASIEDENKRLTELLRGDRMVVATRINHEYTNAKGAIRELQAENERLRALLENTRQQRDDAYSERAEAQKVIKEFELQLKILGDIVDSQNERQKTIISLLKAQQP